MTFYVWNNFCEVVHFQKGDNWSPLSSPLAVHVPTKPEFYRQHSFWLSIDWTHNIILPSVNLIKKSFAIFYLVKHSFKFTTKLVTDDVIKNVCDVITSISNVWFGTKNLTLIYNLSHGYVIFSKTWQWRHQLEVFFLTWTWKPTFMQHLALL